MKRHELFSRIESFGHQICPVKANIKGDIEVTSEENFYLLAKKYNQHTIFIWTKEFTEQFEDELVFRDKIINPHQENETKGYSSYIDQVGTYTLAILAEGKSIVYTHTENWWLRFVNCLK